MLENLLLGIDVAFTYQNLVYCLAGVALGTFVGVLPGIGPLATIAMLLPITFYVPTTSALIMLAGIYYGAQYGGSTAAILLNLPGTPSTAVICLDGYPMAKQGRAGAALFITTIASFVGGCFSILLLATAAPLIADVALHFGSPEYFAMIVLGLLAASTLAPGSALKGVAMVVLGVALGLVGMDGATGTYRFVFGVYELADGLNLVAVAMGLFGVSEILANLNPRNRPEQGSARVSFRTLIPRRDELRQSLKPMMRGSAVGAGFGVLPGTGASIASFISYAMEKRLARDPSRFGKGAVEGIAAPEASNNAAAQAAFVPTLALGIPGDVVMALMLGALMIHGIVPGPGVVVNHPDLFWGLIVSFWIGNMLLLILNIPMIGIWVRILTIPYHVLYPTILFFICIGVFSINNSVFDVFLVIIFGLLGYGMLLRGFPPAPLLLGFILGPLLEDHLQRSLGLSRGDPMIFLERPISALFLFGAALVLALSVRSVLVEARKSEAR